MNYHLSLIGKGRMIISGNNINENFFIVPHGFEIVFWVNENCFIPDDYAWSVVRYPAERYRLGAFNCSYLEGMPCPEHLLTTPSGYQYPSAHSTPPGTSTKLSYFIEGFSLERLQRGMSEKVIVHWCANRLFL